MKRLGVVGGAEETPSGRLSAKTGGCQPKGEALTRPALSRGANDPWQYSPGKIARRPVGGCHANVSESKHTLLASCLCVGATQVSDTFNMLCLRKHIQRRHAMKVKGATFAEDF